MEQLFRKFKQIAVLILAIAFIGCEDDDANLPEVVAGFTYTINADTGTVTFINTSENATSYSWDLGDGTTTTLIDPVKVYPNGTYTIVLTASNVAGDSATFEDTITILIPEIATLPITFDGANTAYDPDVFGGTSFEVVDNPDESGTNPNATKVGAVTNIGEAFEGISFGLGTDIDLTTDKSISMNFWADAPIDVLTKLEEGTGGDLEAAASHGGTGWENIMFNYNSSDSYPRLTIFVDGPGTTAGTFYMDDITQIETPLVCTAEDTESYSAEDLNMTFLTDPSDDFISDGASISRISNPDFDNEVNSSCQIAQVVKSGEFPYDNIQYNLDAKLDFAANEGLKIKVWSARENTEVRIKLEENGVPSNNFESAVTTSVTSGWEELSFPFSSAESNRFDKIVIFFDLDANNTDTYYFDDLMVYGTGIVDPPFDEGLLINGDFETGDETGWIGNAANVLTEGGNSFNFANIATANPTEPFLVNLSQVVEIIQGKTYTLIFDAVSDGNRTILAGIGLNEEPYTNITEVVNLTSTIQTFTYTFTAADFGGVNSRVLFDMAAETGVVVIDDVALFCDDCDDDGGGGTGSGLATNGDFETGDTTGWTTFVDAAGASFAASDAEAACGTFSGNLISDFEAGNGAAVDAVVKQANIGIGTVTPNTQVTISFDIRGSVGDGGVFFAEFFSELSGGGVSSAEILDGGPLNVTDTWTHYSFTTTTGSDVSGGITLQMKTSCGPVANCLVDVYFDNVFVDVGTIGGDDCSGGSGGGGGGGGTGDELASNGDFETGDTSGWATFVDAAGASFTASDSEPSAGNFSGNLIADFDAGTGGAVDAVVKQANVGAGGIVSPNTEYVISFDLRGSAGDGGVFFVEFFSELSGGGVSSAEIITGGPHPLSNTWTSYSYTVTTGSDVSGGITLQMKSSCGPIAGCLVDVFFDNVSIKLK